MLDRGQDLESPIVAEKEDHRELEREDIRRQDLHSPSPPASPVADHRPLQDDVVAAGTATEKGESGVHQTDREPPSKRPNYLTSL